MDHEINVIEGFYDFPKSLTLPFHFPTTDSLKVWINKCDAITTAVLWIPFQPLLHNPGFHTLKQLTLTIRSTSHENQTHATS